MKGNPWTETILYSFGAVGSGDGDAPLAGVTLKSAAATVLYGTKQGGGARRRLGVPVNLCKENEEGSGPLDGDHPRKFSGSDGLAQGQPSSESGRLLSLRQRRCE